MMAAALEASDAPARDVDGARACAAAEARAPDQTSRGAPPSAQINRKSA